MPWRAAAGRSPGRCAAGGVVYRDRPAGQGGVHARAEAGLVLALVQLGGQRSGERDAGDRTLVHQGDRDIRRAGDGLLRQLRDPGEGVGQGLGTEHDLAQLGEGFSRVGHPTGRLDGSGVHEDLDPRTDRVDRRWRLATVHRDGVDRGGASPTRDENRRPTARSPWPAATIGASAPTGQDRLTDGDTTPVRRCGRSVAATVPGGRSADQSPHRRDRLLQAPPGDSEAQVPEVDPLGRADDGTGTTRRGHRLVRAGCWDISRSAGDRRPPPRSEANDGIGGASADSSSSGVLVPMDSDASRSGSAALNRLRTRPDPTGQPGSSGAGAPGVMSTGR